MAVSPRVRAALRLGELRRLAVAGTLGMAACDCSKGRAAGDSGDSGDTGYAVVDPLPCSVVIEEEDPTDR